MTSSPTDFSQSLLTGVLPNPRSVPVLGHSNVGINAVAGFVVCPTDGMCAVLSVFVFGQPAPQVGCYGYWEVGTARCAVPARVPAGGLEVVSRPSAVVWFRRLTLPSATETAQRAVPTLKIPEPTAHSPQPTAFASVISICF